MKPFVMTPERRKELEAEGYRVYSDAKARDIIAEDIFESMTFDQSSIWDIVWNGYKGVDNMTLEDIEDYFSDDYDVLFTWNGNHENKTNA